MAASLPSCLHLSLAPSWAPQRRARRAGNQQQRHHVVWAALEQREAQGSSRARAAAPRNARNTPQQADLGDALTPQQRAQFDSAVRQGDLDACLAVVHAAAGACGGAPTVVLGPERNRALIQACFARGRPDRAVRYLQLVHPAVAPWTAVLKEASRRRDLATLRRVAAARQAAGLPLDHRCATATIAGYSNSGRLPDALAVFCRAWELPECRTVEVANAAISACANQGNWAAAQEVVAIMRKEGVPPDTITYNSLLKAAGVAGLLGEARCLYAELRHAGLRPTTFTYAALFNAAARARGGDAAWLLETFDEMVDAGVQPNDHVLSALFAAASFAPCTPAQLDRLFAALGLLRSLGPPNDQVYTALLTLLQRQAIQERAVDVWTAVKADGVRQSPHLFSSLFAACAVEAPSQALTEVAFEAAQAMQASWQAQEKKGLRGPWDERNMLVAYNALLHFLGSQGELQRSLAVYRGMARHGPAPDVVTFNTLLAAAAGGGNVRVAMQIFSDMVDAEVEPTERTCGALLHCYAKARDAASARKVFESMTQLGIRPNLPIYTSLIDACVQAGGPEWTQMAFELLERMRAEGLAPSTVTYGCLLAACERGGDVDRAFQLYKQACDEGVVPSDQMHDMLISLCTQEQRLEEAVDLVKRLARLRPAAAGAAAGQPAVAGQPPSPKHGGPAAGMSGGGGPGSPGGGMAGSASGLQEHTLNSLIRALCGKYIDRALRLLSLCQTMGMRTSRRTYLALITGCAKASRSAAAYDLYRSLRSQGMDADCATGSALIISLCQAAQLEVAETVYNDMLACAWRRAEAALPPSAPRRGGLSNLAQLPDSEAVAVLVQAFAGTSELRTAAKYYKQLRRVGPKGLAPLAALPRTRRMWELLIEGYCRQHSVKQALQVFDDWKAASDAWLAAQQRHPAAGLEGSLEGSTDGAAAFEPDLDPAATAANPPKLSYVTLAFLEACCRRDEEFEWRVWDVCAVMRQQKESKRQAGLARPEKASHHFLEVPDPTG